jgi:hypothetical protein
VRRRRGARFPERRFLRPLFPAESQPSRGECWRERSARRERGSARPASETVGSDRPAECRRTPTSPRPRQPESFETALTGPVAPLPSPPGVPNLCHDALRVALARSLKPPDAAKGCGSIAELTLGRCTCPLLLIAVLAGACGSDPVSRRVPPQRPSRRLPVWNSPLRPCSLGRVRWRPLP